jgi:putative ABC transport system substrate-binding protein
MRIGQIGVAIAVVLGLLVSLPAEAQHLPHVARVGILSDEVPGLVTSFEPFARGLQDLGWVEGQNLTFERRYAEGKLDDLPSLAGELVRLNPDVIFAVGTPAAAAAKIATRTVPIVFARISDPVGSGLVTALARPGANLTGLGTLTRETAAKRLELLITAVPEAKRIAVLWNPDMSTARAALEDLESAARPLDLELIPAAVRGPEDFDSVLQTMLEKQAAALIMVPPSAGWGALMMRARLPAMVTSRDLVEAGGLMSYGTNYADMYRRTAAYVDKILKGAKPGELPVEEPTKFELFINLKTAKALGLTIPHLLLQRADEVLE